MRILLVNDTSQEANFGCTATSAGLLHSLKGHEIASVTSGDIRRLNREMGRGPFMRFRPSGFTALDHLLAHFALRTMRKDGTIMRMIRETDVVIVNGEGSVHHRRSSSWTILALARAAKEEGKTVHLVNATFEGLGAEDLRIIKALDRVVVREPFSSRYLSRSGINHVLGADAAWIFLRETAPDLRNAGALPEGRGKTLVTYGAVQDASGPEERIGGTMDGAWYLRVDPADDRHLGKTGLRFAGVINAPAETAGRPERLLGIIRRFERLMSGRHHVNIFAYYLGIPVEVFPGNTWKTEATREGYEKAGEEIFSLAKKNVLL